MTDLAMTICRLGKSLFERGLTSGSSGNLSARRPGGGYFVTPTDASLGFLDPSDLAVLDGNFVHIDGPAPTKEMPLHRAFYESRNADAGAVAHLHSPYATALSMMPDLDPDDVLKPYTPYPVMKLGRVALLEYMMPGAAEMADAVKALGGSRKAVLLSNHGPVVVDRDIAAAVHAIEEFEQAARLQFLMQSWPGARTLTAAQVEALRERFPLDRSQVPTGTKQER